jgi:hypothetical protein
MEADIAFNDNFDLEFENCFESNNAKIEAKLAESGSHSIIESEKEKWIAAQTSDFRKHLARLFIENTTYITLQETIEKIEQMIEELYTSNDGHEKDIYLYIGEGYKSFYFFANLFLRIIKEKGYKLPKKYIKKMDKPLLEYLQQKSNYILVIFDDVSYSGSQLSNMLASWYTGTNNIVPRVKVQIPSEFQLNIVIGLIGLNKKSLDRLEYLDCIAFLGKQDYIITVTSPYKLLHTIIYPTLEERVGIRDSLCIKMLFSPWSKQYPLLSLYLDYKVSDEISTFMKTIIFGIVPPSTYNMTGFTYFGNYAFDDVYEAIIPFINLDRYTEYYTPLLTDFNTQFGTTILLKRTKKSSDKSKEIINITGISTQNVVYDTIKKYINDNDIKLFDQPDLTFIPFINTCHLNSQLLAIISNPIVTKMPYEIFMLMEECINNVCSAQLFKPNSSLFLERSITGIPDINRILDIYILYLNIDIIDKSINLINYTTLDIEIDKTSVEYLNKIIIDYYEEHKDEVNRWIVGHHLSNSFRCPDHWYKRGEYALNCIKGGGKNRTNKRTKKTKKNKTKKNKTKKNKTKKKRR